MKFWQVVLLVILISTIGIGVSIWQPWKASSRSIAVTGNGKIKDVPDVAKLQGGIEVKKPTANEAQNEVSSKMSKIVDLLQQEGIEDKDIQTTQVSAYPNYSYSDGKTTQDGYIANTTITVTIRKIDKGQKILDLMIANGATNLYGPNLTFSDEKLEELKKKARENAVKNAKDQAEELAQASGAKVGKVLSISENSYAGGYPMPVAMRDIASSTAKEGSSTIQPGEDEVTVQVSVSYSLK